MSKQLKYWLYELRPLHSVKNVLLLLPLVFAHQWMDPDSVRKAFLAFAVFCLTTSGVYAFNDITDLEKDRHHPLKRLRPLAAGKIGAGKLGVLAFVFLAAAFCVSFLFLNREFTAVLAAYVALNLLYTAVLKHLVILDVMALSVFYALRVLGGMVVIEARISYWMIICVALLALFLGFNKRRHELKLLKKDAAMHRGVLPQYSSYFLDQMISAVTALSLMSYTLYTIDPKTVENAGTGKLILTAPFVYYGIFRYFFLVHKRNRGGDPVRVFTSDWPMIVNIFLWLLACAWVIHFK